MFFVSLLHHPPISTLFPYTTLFRSPLRHDRDVGGPRRAARRDGLRAQFVLPVSVPRRRDARHPDRKSTRLNSSHLGISYAVFCLKKKNKDAPSSSRSTASRCHSSSS